MKLVLIAAHDPNLVIGKDGGLPWHYPEDLKHFKKTTMGYPVLMGRVVFEELFENPLPGRENFVLSRTKDYEEVPTFDSVEKALDYLKDRDKVFVLGGGKVYEQLIPKADQLIITEIHQEHAGDTYFPEYRDTISSVWKETGRQDHDDFSIVWYDRIDY